MILHMSIEEQQNLKFHQEFLKLELNFYLDQILLFRSFLIFSFFCFWIKKEKKKKKKYNHFEIFGLEVYGTILS